LEWVGLDRGKNEKVSNPNVDKIVGLSVLVRNKTFFWSKERIVNGSLALVSFALLVTSIYLAYWYASHPENSPQGTPISSPLIPVLTACAAFFGAIFVNFFKDFIKGDS
jgi:hypothetical protein